MTDRSQINPECIVDPMHGIALWECPCRECTKLDHELCGSGHNLAAHRDENFPEVWAV